MPQINVSYRGELSKLALALAAMAPAIGLSIPDSTKGEVAEFCDRQIENLYDFPGLVDVSITCRDGRVYLTRNEPGEVVIDLRQRTVALVHPDASRVAAIECSLSAR